MPRNRPLPHVKVVTSKGKRYAYFDTGQRKPDGKIIYKPLPPIGDPGFGAAYASCLAGRTRRENVAAVLTVPALVDQYERSPEFKALAANTRKTYGYYLPTIARELNNAPAQEVERRDILALRDKLSVRTVDAKAGRAVAPALRMHWFAPSARSSPGGVTASC